MIEKIVQFIVEEPGYIGFFITVFAGSVSLFKWLDTRNREIKEKRFSKYMDLINTISGKCPDGREPTLTEEIAAVWFLAEYPEYFYITKNVYSCDAVVNSEALLWKKRVLPVVGDLLKEISRRESSPFYKVKYWLSKTITTF